MLTGQYISSKAVLEKVFSDYGFSRSINVYDFINWIGECLFTLGDEAIFVTHTTGESAEIPTIKISNYQGNLPCNLYQVESCKNYVTGVAMRYSSNQFEMLTDDSPDINAITDLTYYLNDNYIITSFEEGEVAMTFTAMKTDEHGWPMVPNRASFLRACTDYVAYRYAYLLNMTDDFPDRKLDRIAAEWHANGFAAQIDAAMPNMDQMETLKNTLLRLAPMIDAHSCGFATMGQTEERRIV